MSELVSISSRPCCGKVSDNQKETKKDLMLLATKSDFFVVPVVVVECRDRTVVRKWTWRNTMLEVEMVVGASPTVTILVS